ncbi:hypothetical protein L218DRAFT_948684 [Marasmius fiardii PR-910]|nr:hypothetical protein L218DRAFT_948684 [Marasmius fiardii PR-910]
MTTKMDDNPRPKYIVSQKTGSYVVFPGDDQFLDGCTEAIDASKVYFKLEDQGYVLSASIEDIPIMAIACVDSGNPERVKSKVTDQIYHWTLIQVSEGYYVIHAGDTVWELVESKGDDRIHYGVYLKKYEARNPGQLWVFTE